MKVALYARTSTSDGRQDLGLQLDELRAEAARRGWTVVAEHTDTASGAQDDRPGLLAALAAAERHEFNVLLVWKLDRLARSLRRLLEVVDALKAAAVDLVSLRDAGIDSTTPGGRLVLQVFGAVAEFERALITERVRAGVVRVKTTGKTKSGKPIGRPRRQVDITAVERLRTEGRSWRSIAQALKIPVRTLRRSASPPRAQGGGAKGGELSPDSQRSRAR